MRPLCRGQRPGSVGSAACPRASCLPAGLNAVSTSPAVAHPSLRRSPDEEGVAIVPGSVMSAHGDFDDDVRLSLGYSEKTLRLGITRLARAWLRYRHATSGATPLHVAI